MDFELCFVETLVSDFESRQAFYFLNFTFPWKLTNGIKIILDFWNILYYIYMLSFNLIFKFSMTLFNNDKHNLGWRAK